MATLLKASRFVRVGLLATLTHILVAASLIETLGTHPALANAIAYSLATLLSYAANTLWSFASPLTLTTLLRFLLVSLISLAATIALSTLVHQLGWPYYIGIAAVVIAVPALSFLLHQRWTYRQAPSPHQPVQVNDLHRVQINKSPIE